MCFPNSRVFVMIEDMYSSGQLLVQTNIHTRNRLGGVTVVFEGSRVRSICTIY